MKSVYLSLGLIMVAHTCAAATGGSIGVKLIIVAPCEIKTASTAVPFTPNITCDKQVESQPKISSSTVAEDNPSDGSRLITVEW